MLVPGITSSSFVGSSKNKPTQPELRPKAILEGTTYPFGDLTVYPYSNDNNSAITSVQIARTPDSLNIPTVYQNGSSISATGSSPGQNISSSIGMTSVLSNEYLSSDFSVYQAYFSFAVNINSFAQSFSSASLSVTDSLTGQAIATYQIAGSTSNYFNYPISITKQNLLNGLKYQISATVTTTDQNTLNYFNYSIYPYIAVSGVSAVVNMKRSFGTKVVQSLQPFSNGSMVNLAQTITYSVKTTNAFGETAITDIPIDVPSINSSFSMGYSTSQDNVLNVTLPPINSTAYSVPVISGYAVSLFKASTLEIAQTSHSVSNGNVFQISGSFTENQEYGITVLAETKDVIIKKTIPYGVFPNRWVSFVPTVVRNAIGSATITIPAHSSGNVSYTVTSSIPLTNNTLSASGESTKSVTVSGSFVHGQAYTFTVTASKPGKSDIVVSTPSIIPNISAISGASILNLGSDSTYSYYLFRASGNISVVGNSLPADILLVGGGGGGGAAWYSNGAGGGGGGAGGVVTAAVNIPVGNSALVLGSGGPGVLGSVTPSTGTNSTFLGYTANGGGWGGYTNSSSPNAAYSPGSGGSGGGAGGAFSGTTGPASGISGQGNSGGGSSDAYWNGNVSRVPGGGGGGGKALAGSSGSGSPANDSGGSGGKGGDGVVPFDSSVVASAMRNTFSQSFPLDKVGVGGGGAGGGGKNYDYTNSNNWNSYTQVQQNIGGSWGFSWSGDTSIIEQYPISYTGGGGFGNTFFNGSYPPLRTFNSGSAYYNISSGAMGGLYIRVLKNLVGL